MGVSVLHAGAATASMDPWGLFSQGVVDTQGQRLRCHQELGQNGQAETHGLTALNKRNACSSRVPVPEQTTFQISRFPQVTRWQEIRVELQVNDLRIWIHFLHFWNSLSPTYPIPCLCLVQQRRSVQRKLVAKPKMATACLDFDSNSTTTRQDHLELIPSSGSTCKREQHKMHHQAWLCGLHSLTRYWPLWSHAWTAGSIGCKGLVGCCSYPKTTAMAFLSRSHGQPLQGNSPNSAIVRQNKVTAKRDSCWKKTRHPQYFWDLYSMVSWPSSPLHLHQRESSKSLAP